MAEFPSPVVPEVEPEVSEDAEKEKAAEVLHAMSKGASAKAFIDKTFEAFLRTILPGMRTPECRPILWSAWSKDKYFNTLEMFVASQQYNFQLAIQVNELPSGKRE